MRLREGNRFHLSSTTELTLDGDLVMPRRRRCRRQPKNSTRHVYGAFHIVPNRVRQKICTHRSGLLLFGIIFHKLMETTTIQFNEHILRLSVRAHTACVCRGNVMILLDLVFTFSNHFILRQTLLSMKQKILESRTRASKMTLNGIRIARL